MPDRLKKIANRVLYAPAVGGSLISYMKNNTKTIYDKILNPFFNLEDSIFFHNIFLISSYYGIGISDNIRKTLNISDEVVIVGEKLGI